MRSLLRWIGHLARPAPRHLRRMGYVRELRALGARQDRCRAAWEPHLERTRAVIVEAAARCDRRRTALVVGSGLLFDVPLTELSRRFDRVVLADVVHLARVHRQAARLPNVSLVALDVTGVVKDCYTLARTRTGAPLPRRPVDVFRGERFDLVVSVNVLSQLPVLPNEILSHRIRSLSDADVTAFSRALLVNHLDWLCASTEVACLVADLERLHCDGARVVHREGSLWGVELPPGGQEWIWELAPRPEIDLRFDVRHRVVGYPSFPRDGWRRRGDASGISC